VRCAARARSLAVADSLAAAVVEPLLTGRFGRPYRYEESCESTQLLLEGATEGAVAVCDEQTSGRGRLGRTWQAPPGTAILCSILVRPPVERRMPELSLVGGMAAADAVEQALGLTAQIKWPNDVMVNRRKVAGVLAEAREGAVVLGVGLNVNQTRDELPADAPSPAASLRTIDGVERDRAPILATLLARFEASYDAWCDAGLEAIYDFLGARDFLRGRRVAVDGSEGHAVGIDRQGRLEVETDGGRRSFESGEVRYER
jgi:BirA family transcriptional regulator, biotin operon repressor / biotin---[acetyl-CoA-carboxylase] ligase